MTVNEVELWHQASKNVILMNVSGFIFTQTCELSSSEKSQTLFKTQSLFPT